MTDTITIGGTTYHKLVTFKDCASTENGGRGLFPWALVDYDESRDSNENSKVLSFDPKYFSEKTEQKCISYKGLENSPLDAIGSYATGHTIGGTTYEQLVCKKDLRYGTSKNPAISGKIYNNSDLIIAQNFHITVGDDTSRYEICSWEAPKLKESKTFTSKLATPADNTNFKIGVWHSGSDNKYFKLRIESNNGISDQIFETRGKKIGEQGTPAYYSDIYNGESINYKLFWNVCKQADLKGHKMYFYIEFYD